MQLAAIPSRKHVRLDPQGAPRRWLQKIGSTRQSGIHQLVIRNADDMRKYVDTALDWLQAGTAVLRHDGRQDASGHRSTRLATSTSRTGGRRWMDLAHPKWWRTQSHRSQVLMLRHAFEHEVHSRRAQDAAKNERSRAAILRIGARRRYSAPSHDSARRLLRDSVYSASRRGVASRETAPRGTAAV